MHTVSRRPTPFLDRATNRHFSPIAAAALAITIGMNLGGCFFPSITGAGGSGGASRNGGGGGGGGGVGVMAMGGAGGEEGEQGVRGGRGERGERGGQGGRGGQAYHIQPSWPARDPAITLARLSAVQAELIAMAAQPEKHSNNNNNNTTEHTNDNNKDHGNGNNNDNNDKSSNTTAPLAALVASSSVARSPWIIEPTRHGAIVRITNREINPPSSYNTNDNNEDLTLAFSNLWIGFLPNAYFHTSRSTETRHHHPLQQQAGLFSLESGIPLRLPHSIPDNPRGLLVHYTALTGSDYERAVVQRFADEGWIVIDVSTRINVRAPDFISLTTATASSRRQALSAALGQQQRFARTWFVDPATDTAELGKRIAHAVDDAIAENALAAEAAIELLERRFPSTSTLDVAYIGFSAGALVGPATTERLRKTLGNRLKAAIYIGGGANTFDIADRSATTIRTMRLHWIEPTPQTNLDDHFDDTAEEADTEANTNAHNNAHNTFHNPPSDRPENNANNTTTTTNNDQADPTTNDRPRVVPIREPSRPSQSNTVPIRRPPPHITHAVNRSYIQHATLDPQHAIARLDGVRILIIDATFDAVVPTSTANRLAAAAPRKTTDRWRFIGGHLGLFAYLPPQAPNLTRWLERAVKDNNQ